MKTPYDPAVRILQREIDDMRASIGAASDQLANIEARGHALTRAIGKEHHLATSDIALPSTAYFARARADRERLARDAAEAEARLTELRLQAMESYGSLRALEGAADEYRATSERALAVADQSRIDDFTAARFSRELRTARSLIQKRKAADPA